MTQIYQIKQYISIQLFFTLTKSCFHWRAGSSHH